MKYFLLTVVKETKWDQYNFSCTTLKSMLKWLLKCHLIFVVVVKLSHFRNISSFLSSSSEFWVAFFQSYFCNNWENYHAFSQYLKMRDNYFLCVKLFFFPRLDLAQNKSDSILSPYPACNRNITKLDLEVSVWLNSQCTWGTSFSVTQCYLSSTKPLLLQYRTMSLFFTTRLPHRYFS